MDATAIQARFDKAKALRNILEPTFDDAFRLTMPLRPRFSEANPRTTDDIFDETGANAVSEFVSRMSAGLTPSFTPFVKLQCSSLVAPNDRKAINEDLKDIQDYIFEEIWASNFAQEQSECLYDLAVSTSTMLVEEGTAGNLLQHRSIPMTETYLEGGPNGGIGGRFRCSKVKAKDLPTRYKYARFSAATMDDIKKQGDKELEALEYTRQDFTASQPVFHHVVMIVEHKDICVQRKLKGLGSNPFITSRWTTSPGQVWGRGPLIGALAAVRTTNLMVEMVLENAAMAIIGMYQTDNDGIVNADNVTLLPGTIIAKDPQSSGLEQIKGHGGQFNMQDVVLNDQRINIKRALFNDMLSDPNKTPATAYEVSERMADLAHRTSAGFSRYFYEGITPYIRRVLYLAEKKGDIKLPVQNGRAIDFMATSPLAQAQAGRDIQRLMQDFQIRTAMWGPAAASGMYKLEEIMPWLEEKMALDPKLYKSAKDIIEVLRQQTENLQQQMQQQPQPQQQP